MNKHYVHSAFQILKLRARILNLNSQYLRRELYPERNILYNLDNRLAVLLKSLDKYDFIKRISSGSALFVGEGNFSFVYTLAKMQRQLGNIIASTYEKYTALSDFSKHNLKLLEKIGVHVLQDVDATKLHKTFNEGSFDTIIFQFPHTGNRESVNNLNPNYVLVRDFIISAYRILKMHGIILITVVDNDYYNNIFKFGEIAELCGLSTPIKYVFDPDDYPGYIHTMAHREGSAIDEYDQFATWEFQV